MLLTGLADPDRGPAQGEGSQAAGLHVVRAGRAARRCRALGASSSHGLLVEGLELEQAPALVVEGRRRYGRGRGRRRRPASPDDEAHGQRAAGPGAARWRCACCSPRGRVVPWRSAVLAEAEARRGWRARLPVVFQREQTLRLGRRDRCSRPRRIATIAPGHRVAMTACSEPRVLERRRGRRFRGEGPDASWAPRRAPPQPAAPRSSRSEADAVVDGVAGRRTSCSSSWAEALEARDTRRFWTASPITAEWMRQLNEPGAAHFLATNSLSGGPRRLAPGPSPLHAPPAFRRRASVPSFTQRCTRSHSLHTFAQALDMTSTTLSPSSGRRTLTTTPVLQLGDSARAQEGGAPRGLRSRCQGRCVTVRRLSLP